MSAALRREQAELQERRARQLAAQQQQQATTAATKPKRYGAVDANFIANLQTANDDFLSRLGHAEARDSDRGGKDKKYFAKAATNNLLARIGEQHDDNPIDESNWMQRSQQVGQGLHQAHQMQQHSRALNGRR